MRYDNHLFGILSTLWAFSRRMVSAQSSPARLLGAVVIVLCLTLPALGQRSPNQQPRRSPYSRSAERWIEDGKRYIQQENYSAALECFEKALDVTPDDPVAHLGKGYALHFLNKRQQALTSLAEAHTQSELLSRAEHYALHLVMGAVYGKLNRPSEAISEFSSATRVDPDAVEAHRSLAEAYLENKDNVNAKKTALRAIQLDEGDYRSHIALGDANFNLRYYQDAINAYRRAVQIQSNAAKAHLMMGRSYFMLGQDREAVTAYHQALRFKTDYPVDTNYFMSLAHVRLRDFDAALEDLREALRIDPKYAYAHLQMASLYQQQGRYEDAIANTQKFVDLRPADGDGYIVLSWYYSFLRRHEAAAQAGLKAVQYAPERHMGYTNLCRALYDLGEYRNAMQRCQRAIELKPRDGETLFYMGRVHEALKNPVEAKRAFAGALTGMLEFVRQNPKDADGRYLLGNIYMANEQPRSAIEAYRMAISLQPRFPFAISNLGIAYLWVKDRQSALAQYRELQSIDLVEAEKLLKKIEPRRTGRR